MLDNKRVLVFGVFSLNLISSSVVAEKSPGQVLDESWEYVCPNAIRGSELEARCAGIGGGNNAGIEAGIGNNAGVSSGVGNSTVYNDRRNKKIVEERQDKLKQQRAAGDILSEERLGFFVSGKLNETERENTVLESGYESDMQGVTVGVDYFFTNDFVAGLSVDYMSTDLDYSADAGSSDYESVSVIAYANHRVTNEFSIDGYVGWTGVDYDLKRKISYDLTCGCDVVNATASSDEDANKVLAGMSFFYTLSKDALSVTPLLRLNYSGTFLDSYTESGGDGYALDYENQEIQSFESLLGLDASYAASFSWGVLLPRIKAGYVHQFLDQRRTIHASFVQDAGSYDLEFKTDKPDRDYFVFGGGISAILAHGVQFFVDYERVEGHRYINSYTVSGGVRVGL